MVRLLSKPAVIALLIGLLAAISAGLIAWQATIAFKKNDEISPGAMRPNVEIGGPFTLTNHHGEQVSASDFEGKHLLIYFGFTFCPDVCPLDLAIIGDTMDLIAEEEPDLKDRIQPLFITIDPERDTPDVIGEYATTFHPDFIGLTGSVDEIGTVASSFKVYYAKNQTGEDADDYLMDHSAFTYVAGPDARVQLIFRRDTDPAIMADDIIALF